jgi:hypothetical protein
MMVTKTFCKSINDEMAEAIGKNKATPYSE